MSLAGGWIAVPCLLLVLAAGLGLLAERAAGVRLPGALVPVVGMAALIVVAGLLTLADATAELAAPACALLAVAGIGLGRPWSDPRLHGRGAAAALATVAAAFALAAAPSLLTGQGSIGGYGKLDDSATWILHTAHVMEHGRDLSGLRPSTPTLTLESWLGTGYPVGSFLPLGVASELSGQDPASGYQATIAIFAALLALGLAACMRAIAGGPWAAAAAGVAGTQASMFAGYLQWGGIKEGAAATLLPALALLAVRAWRSGGLRALALAALVAGALAGVLGANGAAWAAPALALGALGVLVALRRGGLRLPQLALGLAATACVLTIACWPAISTLEFFEHTTDGAITAQEDIGNLDKPPSLLQGAGLWPGGDIREDPDPRAGGVLLALLCLIGCAAAVALDARRLRTVEPDVDGIGVRGSLVALVAVTAAGSLPALALAAPWVDAKILAISAPVVLAGAAALAAMLLRSAEERFRAGGAALAVLLTCGVAWSTFAVAAEVVVAPRERLAELHDIGELIEGQGPTLVLDYEIYASRHFLRNADTAGATDLRVRPVRRVDGELFEDLSTAEVDQVATRDLFVYRTLVRRRSPVASRPPAAYRLRAVGKAFEVWQRDPAPRPPLARLPLGDAVDPTGTATCAAVRGLARTPGAVALAAVPRLPPAAGESGQATVPGEWLAAGDIAPSVSGTATLQINVPSDGEWRPWVEGSVLGRLELRVDGRSAGSIRHDVSLSQWLMYEPLMLAAGNHLIELRYARGLRAGSGYRPLPLGQVALAPTASEDDLPITRVPAGRWRDLCRPPGRRYDWIEAE